MTAPAAALGLTPLTWPSDPRPDAADRRWAHRLLHGLAVELDHAAHAHTLLAALLNDLHDPPAEHRRLTQRLQAVDHAAVPAHDTADLLDRLDRHGPPDAAAELRRAHHRLAAVAAIRAIVDLDRLGVLDTAVVPPPGLNRALDLLAATGAAVAAADAHLLTALHHIHQPEEAISYSASQHHPPHPKPDRGISVSSSGEFRRRHHRGAEDRGGPRHRRGKGVLGGRAPCERQHLDGGP